jgi:hypothetical protein
LVYCFQYHATALDDSVLSAKAQTSKARNGMVLNVLAQIVETLIDSVRIVATRNAKVAHRCRVVTVLKVHYAVLHCVVAHYVVAVPHFFAAALQPVKVVHFVAAALSVAVAQASHFFVRVAKVRLARDYALVCPLNRNLSVDRHGPAYYHHSQPGDVRDEVR